MKKKTVALLLACVMALGVAIGGTMAWLVDSTGEVKNTFTVGDINIDLSESVDTDKDDIHNYDFVPGDKLDKDPKVTVEGGSENCYVFVKIVVANNTCGNVNPIVDWDFNETDWDVYPANGTVSASNGTYYLYREVSKNANDQSWYVLESVDHDADCPKDDTCDCVGLNGYVTLSDDVTKDMVNTINATATQPTLSFWAAAVQKEHLSLEEAFALAWPTT